MEELIFGNLKLLIYSVAIASIMGIVAAVVVWGILLI